MSQDERIKALMAAFHKTTYFKWMASQNIPVIDGYGLEDVRDVAMAPWARTGDSATPICGAISPLISPLQKWRMTPSFRVNTL